MTEFQIDFYIGNYDPTDPVLNKKLNALLSESINLQNNIYLQAADNKILPLNNMQSGLGIAEEELNGFNSVSNAAGSDADNTASEEITESNEQCIVTLETIIGVVAIQFLREKLLTLGMEFLKYVIPIKGHSIPVKYFSRY